MAGRDEHGTVTDCAATEPLPGAMTGQYIKCGKPGCRCGEGGQKHGPYYYRVWREGAAVHKEYVPAAEVERVRARCDLYHRVRAELKRLREERERLSSEVRREWRRYETMRAGMLRKA